MLSPFLTVILTVMQARLAGNSTYYLSPNYLFQANMQCIVLENLSNILLLILEKYFLLDIQYIKLFASYFVIMQM